MVNCTSPDCPRPGSFWLVEVEKRRVRKENIFCFEHGEDYAAHYPWDTAVGSGLGGMLEGAVCFDIELILLNSIDGQNHGVYLREVGQKRLFGFATGPTEANLILNLVKHPSSPQPHSAMNDLLRVLGAKLEHVVVDEARDVPQMAVFRSSLFMTISGQHLSQKVRISDGLGLAVAAGLPFFIANSIL
jgi:bifunctional DNase/RNase